MNINRKYTHLRMILVVICALAAFCLPMLLSSHSPIHLGAPLVEIPRSDWHYRWQRSPVSDEIPSWLYDDAADSDWKLMQENFRQDQQGSQVLWFRIRLPDEYWENPALTLPPVDRDVEIYQDRQRLYRHGEFSPAKGNKFLAYKWHHISLIRKPQNSTIFLKIYSDRPGSIGIMEHPMLWAGHQMDLIRHIIMFGLEHIILGFVFVLVGMVSILIYFIRREEGFSIALSFGFFAAIVGIGRLAGNSISHILISDLVLKYYLNFISFFLFPIPMYIFFEQILEKKFRRIIRRGWQIHILFAAITIVLDVANLFPLIFSTRFLFGLLMLGICVSFPIATISAHRGNFESRMLQVGIFIMMSSGVNDMLIGFRVIPSWRYLFTWGMFGLILCVGYVLERRFAQARHQLKEYSLTLEQKVEDRTQELSVKNTALERAYQELSETQAQMAMQSKMASLGDLVAGVAHEMNNPLGVIHSAADTANRGVSKIKDSLQDSQQEQLQQPFILVETNHEIITAASERIAETVQSLKTFARLDEALFQQVDIHTNINTTLTLIQHELKDRIAVTKNYGEIPLIPCYPNELNQALMNLLRNAVAAIEKQGTIAISTSTDNTQVFIKISDTGKGIPSDELPKIFDPGFTTQSGGVGKGLGLSIVYNIIQKHQGDIKVDSEVGNGTVVTVALPIRQG